MRTCHKGFCSCEELSCVKLSPKLRLGENFPRDHNEDLWIDETFMKRSKIETLCRRRGCFTDYLPIRHNSLLTPRPLFFFTYLQVENNCSERSHCLTHFLNWGLTNVSYKNDNWHNASEKERASWMKPLVSRSWCVDPGLVDELRLLPEFSLSATILTRTWTLQVLQRSKIQIFNSIPLFKVWCCLAYFLICCLHILLLKAGNIFRNFSQIFYSTNSHDRFNHCAVLPSNQLAYERVFHMIYIYEIGNVSWKINCVLCDRNEKSNYWRLKFQLKTKRLFNDVIRYFYFSILSLRCSSHFPTTPNHWFHSVFSLSVTCQNTSRARVSTIYLAVQAFLIFLQIKLRVLYQKFVIRKIVRS